MPQGHAHACQQLIRVERFRYIVIGASIQRGDFAFFVVPHRKYDDRRGAPFPQPP
jgi:hypothetical protein